MTKAKQFNRLVIMLAALDAFLTFKDYRECKRHAVRSDTVYGLLSWADVFYLSDGGYSRVGYDDCPGKLYLTYNSRDEVRKRWDMQDAWLKQLKEEITELVVSLHGYRKEENDVRSG